MYVVMGAHDVLVAPLDTLGNDIETLVTTVRIEEIRHCASETALAATDIEDVRGWAQIRNSANSFQRAPAAGSEVHWRTSKYVGFRREPRIVAAAQSVSEVGWCQVHLAQDPAQLTRKRGQQLTVEPCLPEQQPRRRRWVPTALPWPWSAPARSERVSAARAPPPGRGSVCLVMLFLPIEPGRPDSCEDKAAQPWRRASGSSTDPGGTHDEPPSPGLPPKLKIF